MAKAADVTDAISRYIENSLPIYLIHLPSNQLMKRSDLVKTFVGFAMDKATIHNFLLYNKSEIEKQVRIWVKRGTRYAIFSHRWSNDEPSFEKMHDGKVDIGSTGGKKLAEFCKRARKFGCEYAWTDTCCIDKANNAEFQESLNSMFNWYQHAMVCIVYLGETTSMEGMKDDVWFKRGWTLQEILAPMKMRFYNQFWQPLNNTKPKSYAHPYLRDQDATNPRAYDNIRDQDGDVMENFFQQNDKSDKYFLKLLSGATNIPVEYLKMFTPESSDIRMKLNWASDRTTTRVEDMAYSLMGIFDVQLTIMYGEGEKAFFRFQKEIMERCSEMGLFVWNGQASRYNSMLAANLACFKSPIPDPDLDPDFNRDFNASAEYSRFQISRHTESVRLEKLGGQPETSFRLTNKGLYIQLSLYDVLAANETGSNTSESGSDTSEYVLKTEDLDDVITEVDITDDPSRYKLAILNTSSSVLFDKNSKGAVLVEHGTERRAAILLIDDRFVVGLCQKLDSFWVVKHSSKAWHSPKFVYVG